jgi:hypothetical protein
MIAWMSLSKPEVNIKDKFDAENEISSRVLVRVIDVNGNFCGYSFGKFFHSSQHWSIEGYRGGFDVSHWSEINDPDEFKMIVNINDEDIGKI